MPAAPRPHAGRKRGSDDPPHRNAPRAVAAGPVLVSSAEGRRVGSYRLPRSAGPTSLGIMAINPDRRTRRSTSASSPSKSSSPGVWVWVEPGEPDGS